MSTTTELRYHLYRSLWDGLYHTTLLGGEFDNCHGQGRTPEAAVMSLRLAVNFRRRALTRNKQSQESTDDRKD